MERMIIIALIFEREAVPRAMPDGNRRTLLVSLPIYCPVIKFTCAAGQLLKHHRNRFVRRGSLVVPTKRRVVPEFLRRRKPSGLPVLPRIFNNNAHAIAPIVIFRST